MVEGVRGEEEVEGKDAGEVEMGDGSDGRETGDKVRQSCVCVCVCRSGPTMRKVSWSWLVYCALMCLRSGPLTPPD